MTSAYQVISDWPVEITFLGKAEIAIGLGIKSQFVDVGLTQVTAFWAFRLFF